MSYAARKATGQQQELLALLDEVADQITTGTINASWGATYEPGGTSIVTLTLKWMRS